MKIKFRIKREINKSYYPPWARRKRVNRLFQWRKTYPLSYKDRKIEFPRFELKKHLPYLIVTTAIITSYYQNDDLLIFLSYIILIPIFTILKFDGRIPIGYAILLLIIAAVILATGNEDLANQLAIYTYWLLVVGVICLTIEYIREERKNSRNIE
ncbi:MAG TPA: hypothetical protein ENI44_00775 [Thermoplasmatales archaeon]|nr:hypothetical protein [Thermoplasmatales archaeon]